MARKRKVYLLAGTHKGAFFFTSDEKRKEWKMRGPFLKGMDVNSLVLDVRSEPTLYAAANSFWWGPGIQYSQDFGKTWHEAETDVRFGEKEGKELKRAWYVKVGLASEPGVLYAGVDPAALFKTEDGGKNWIELKGLSNHSTRQKWSPGAGGLMVHCMSIHPEDGKKIYVGISAAGVFYSGDGGTTWEPRNKGVLADFLPEKYPVVGQCVHHMESHPVKPDILYQQNHCGVYRSDNGGKDWKDISRGLPSRFGFPLKIHPYKPDTIYVIPEQGPEFRAPVNGAFGVYRSRNRGVKWEKLTKGLPARNAYLQIYRQAMAVDDCDSSGLYVGTSTGQIFYSRDEGNSWQVLSHWMPPVFSLECVVAG